ncbi:TonB-dependent receptor [Spartinivicinus poritis]|uniref:TonB-dependent receptor n=1 Tax=Spartinivicinus poritis TaxID=2994640 RepID=A0ABT5UC89_9GAMM|nr:TonB-dependent receptor [Spartinivicinus sp. A2-2]MDE1463122.1 TonB-dependent receptor [Spartinivicinus sp. A2-2]
MKYTHLSLSSFWGVVIFLPYAVFAEEPSSEEDSSYQMDSVVVTATRYAQDIDKIAGAISVIDSKELQQQTLVADDLTSVIANLVPSFTPSRQKLSNQGENMRGRNVLIMVDGIPQNNPLRNGNRYGYTIDPSMIERIEVINGASAVQGIGATGGIINYISKGAKPGDEWKQTIGSRITSNLHNDGAGHKLHYSLSQFDEHYDLFLAGSWQEQGLYYDGNGKPIGMNQIQGETQDSTSYNGLFKGGYKFDEGSQRLTFFANQYRLKSNNNYIAVPGDFKKDIPGTVTKGKPEGKPVSNSMDIYSLTYNHYDLAEGSLTAKLFMQDYNAVFGQALWWPTPDKSQDQGVIKSSKKGFKLSYERSDLIDIDDIWVAGLDGLQDETTQELAQSGLKVTPLMQYRSLAPFIQGDFMIGENLRLSGGVRFENTWVKVDDGKTLYGFGNAGQHNVDIIGGEQKFSKTVFNVGAIYNFTPELSTFVSFNQGFGLPDIGRILRGNWVGGNSPNNKGNAPINFNTMPAVEPVVTDNYEVGASYRNDSFAISSSIYTSIAKDGANLKLNSAGTYDVERQRTEIKGYELKATYHALSKTKLQTMYSHVEGQVDTNGNGDVDSDMDLRNLSPDRLMLAVDHEFNNNLSGRIQYNHLFSREKKANGAGSKQNFDGYGLVDFSVNYNMGNYGRIGFGVENVLNKNYINYFSQIRNHSSYYFSGRGRTFSLSYEFDL